MAARAKSRKTRRPSSGTTTKRRSLSRCWETDRASHAQRVGAGPALRTAGAWVQHPGAPHGSWRVFVLQSGDRWIEVAERLDIRDELCTMLALTSVTPLHGRHPCAAVAAEPAHPLRPCPAVGACPSHRAARAGIARSRHAVAHAGRDRTGRARAEWTVCTRARRAGTRAPIHGSRRARAAHAACGAQAARGKRSACRDRQPAQTSLARMGAASSARCASSSRCSRSAARTARSSRPRPYRSAGSSPPRLESAAAVRERRSR